MGLQEDGSILVEDRPEEIGMRDIGMDSHNRRQLVIGIGESRTLIKEEYITGLIADKAERVEIVNMHDLGGVHGPNKFIKGCDKLNK